MARAIRFDSYGGTELLYIADVEIPHPRAGEVLVAVRAAGINPGEAAVCRGAMESRFPATFHSGEGSDLAGVVTEIGEGITSYATGDNVLGWTDHRASHVENVSVPEDHLIPKPGSVSNRCRRVYRYLRRGVRPAGDRARGRRKPDHTIIAFDVAQATGVKSEASAAAASAEVLAEMADLVASGQIIVPIAAIYPLEEVRAAYPEVEKRHTRG